MSLFCAKNGLRNVSADRLCNTRILRRAYFTRIPWVNRILPNALGVHSLNGRWTARKGKGNCLHAAHSTISEVAGDYEALCAKQTEIETLRGVSTLLTWDKFVAMPPGANAARGQQLTTIAGILHDKETDEALGELIRNLSQTPDGNLDDVQRANVRIAKRNWERKTAITKELESRKVRLSNECTGAWERAREANDFSIVAPILTEILEVEKEIAKAIDPDKAPYDVLLDGFETGMTMEELDVLFGNLKPFLVSLVKQIVAKKDAKGLTFEKEREKFVVDYEKPKMEELVTFIVKRLGYDMNHGRLDVCTHPMAFRANQSDVRIATRYKEKDVFEPIVATVHESGHAMYEQGLNPRYNGLPVGQYLSVGVHESQSLTWERMVGKSKEFWKWAWPLVQQHIPTLPDVSYEEYYKALNAVELSMIRVQADELTYHLHIILRYEIERDLISGALDVDDLPDAWNKKMEENLGIVPKNNGEGCLQDIHWFAGAFGYFPTYTLGALFAAQLFDSAVKANPGLRTGFSEGKFEPLLAWLRENVHMKASMPKSADDLLKEATGKPLDADVFKAYIKEKYTDLYEL